ncbi:hypothetical protein TrVE_jg7114 [Triparma verrucosa]|uniref:CoA transferase n=1 Tax=Triparma verrucosa TaxID=1606542 RepID=A0A9W7B4Z4_9STRA|nr:hypothetical protein TrVE_jg7114 [Triparma verrucosa]
MSLAGLKILDISRVLAGPSATQTLASLGASVLKVEPPSGDLTRSWLPPVREDVGTYFGSCNRGKKSLSLDLLKRPDILHSLIKTSDVVLHNYLPKVAKKLKVDYDSCSTINPKIIHCEITGYGYSSGWSEKPGFDVITSCEYGLVSCTGSLSPGVKPGVALVDYMTGQNAVIGILSKLHERSFNKDHFDGSVQVALKDTCVNALLNVASSEVNRPGEREERYGNAHESIVPYQVFEAQTGYLVVGCGTDDQFTRFAQCLEMEVEEEWKDNRGRVEDRERVVDRIQDKLKGKGREEWLEVFRGKGFAYGAVRTVKEAMECESIQDSRLTVSHSSGRVFEGLRSAIRTDHWRDGGRDVNGETFPPFLGEHSVEILKGMGIREEEIQGMIARGEVVQWQGG